MSTAPEPRWAGSYPRRLVIYLCAAGVASVGGSSLNQFYDNWQDAGIVGALWFAYLGLAPAVTIVAFAKLSARAVAGVAVLLAGAMVTMWWLFVSSESSTAVLAFLAGWIYGIPVAMAIVAVSWRRGRASGDPTSPGPVTGPGLL